MKQLFFNKMSTFIFVYIYMCEKLDAENKLRR